MDSNFNRQFILIDFRLLEDGKFLKFIGSSEFATYLVLRRNIWRSAEPHFMGLHDLYLRDQLLTCSLEREKISKITNVDPDNISRHLTSLVRKGVMRRIRTGRQNIYVLGEWVDVHGNGSYRLEWFYLEGKYGISKTDLTESVRSDLSGTSDQTRLKASDNNIEANREENTVNGDLKELKNLDQPEEKTEYVAQCILSEFGDQHSLGFYRLVAAKVPEEVIHRAIAEIRADGAKSPARVFTHKMKLYALDRLKKRIGVV